MTHASTADADGRLGPVTSGDPGRTIATEPGFGLGTIAGVRVRIDWSLLIIFALVAFNLGAGVFPSWHPDWGPALTWGVALGAAILFFASVLVHELSHALVARAHGVSVRSITLFLFGGMANMEGEPEAPRAEFLIAIVGPITSVAIGVGATLIGAQLAGGALEAQGVLAGQASEAELRSAAAAVGPIATLLLWLGPINLLLGIFNLVPGFPLDGGRVLRALLWWSTGDITRATRWAAAAGQAFAWLLMILGVLNLFEGAPGQGLWLILIGWFLNNAARASYQQVLTRKAFENVRVSQLMWTQPQQVPPELNLDRLVHEFLLPHEQAAFPVERDGEVLGIVRFDDVRGVPRERWSETSVERVMVPLSDLPSLSPESDAMTALDELVRRDFDQLPVLEDGRLRGLLRRREVVRWIALKEGR